MRLNINAGQMKKNYLKDSLIMIKDSWFVPIYTTESWYRFSLTGLACHKPLETNVDVNWGANVYADLDIWEFAE